MNENQMEQEQIIKINEEFIYQNHNIQNGLFLFYLLNSNLNWSDQNIFPQIDQNSINQEQFFQKSRAKKRKTLQNDQKTNNQDEDVRQKQIKFDNEKVLIQNQQQFESEHNSEDISSNQFQNQKNIEDEESEDPFNVFKDLSNKDQLKNKKNTFFKIKQTYFRNKKYFQPQSMEIKKKFTGQLEINSVKRNKFANENFQNKNQIQNQFQGVEEKKNNQIWNTNKEVKISNQNQFIKQDNNFQKDLQKDQNIENKNQSEQTDLLQYLINLQEINFQYDSKAVPGQTQQTEEYKKDVFLEEKLAIYTEQDLFNAEKGNSERQIGEIDIKEIRQENYSIENKQDSFDDEDSSFSNCSEKRKQQYYFKADENSDEQQQKSGSEINSSESSQDQQKGQNEKEKNQYLQFEEENDDQISEQLKDIYQEEKQVKKRKRYYKNKSTIFNNPQTEQEEFQGDILKKHEDTKNLLRNYGSALARFILQHKQAQKIIQDFVEQQNEFTVIEFKNWASSQKLENFEQFKSIWHVAEGEQYFKYKQLFRTLSFEFYHKHAVVYVLSSQMRTEDTKKTHVRYIFRFLEGILDPSSFYYFKQLDRLK